MGNGVPAAGLAVLIARKIKDNQLRMKYLHTMVRISDIDESLDFYCNKLGMEEVYRYESSEGRFTNIFLKASGDDVGAAPEEKKQGKSVHKTGTRAHL